MLSATLSNGTTIIADPSDDSFHRPLRNDDIGIMAPDTAARFCATIDAIADAGFKTGKTEGAEEGRDAGAKIFQQDFARKISGIVHAILNEDANAALKAVEGMSITFCSLKAFDAAVAKAKKATEPADGGSHLAE